MAYRYSRRIKICKGVHLNVSKSGIGVSLGVRGASISMGPRGTYVNTGLPGTGLSYRKKISDNSSNSNRDLSNIREQEVVPGSILEFQIDDDGKETVYLKDPSGYCFTNETFLRRVKRSDEYKEMVIKARKMKYESIKEKNDNCVEIYKQTPKLITEEEVIKEKENPSEINQKYYKVKRFDKPLPNETKLYDEARSWACDNVKTNIFNRKKKIILATQERLKDLFDTAKKEWIDAKNNFLIEERKNKEIIDKKYEKEYFEALEERVKAYDEILNPDDKYINETVGFILSQIQLPVDFDIEYSVKDRVINLDIDLPEIEDYPQSDCSILSSGKLSIKKKTVTDLNKEYATSVVGMAFFFAGTVFNISPKIERITISGYTQRLSKKTGNIEDQYVYTVGFNREKFSSLNINCIDPLEAISNFENTLDITSKYELKTIKVRDSSENKLLDTEKDISEEIASEVNLDTNYVETDFSYSPQEVIDDYNEDFECTILQEKSAIYKQRELQSRKRKRFFLILLGIVILGTIFYCYKKPEVFYSKIILLNVDKKTDFKFLRMKKLDKYSFIFLENNNTDTVDESILKELSDKYAKQNPVFIVVAPKKSEEIIDGIEKKYTTNTKLSDELYLLCAKSVMASYNYQQVGKLDNYPLKNTERFKSAAIIENEKAIQREKEAQELAEKNKKEQKEKAARQSKLRSNYLYTRTVKQHETILKNPKLGLKGGGTTQYVDVVCIYAYCPDKSQANQMIQDIREIEKTGRLYIYLYDQKFSQTEIQKGQIDGHIDYKNVRDHLIETWFYK